MRDPAEADGLRCLLDRDAASRRARSPKKSFQKAQVLRDRQLALHRVAVAEIVAELRAGAMSERPCRISEADRALPGGRRPATTRSKVDFPDPFRPGQHQRFAGRRSKGTFRENQVFAPPCSSGLRQSRRMAFHVPLRF